MAELRGCGEMETPILEPSSLYASLGATSDINVHETYNIAETDPPLVLRPEGTAGVARAVSEAALRRGARHGLRYWYAGPMFRRERPQAGRFRQFTQLGVEFIDPAPVSDPVPVKPAISSEEHVRLDGDAHDLNADVDVIELAHDFLVKAGLHPRLRLNTLGTTSERKAYNAALKEFLLPRVEQLSAAGRLRLEAGDCVRIADSQRRADVEAMQGAPSLAEFVGKRERRRFDALCAALKEVDVTFEVDFQLVRGLDYYTSTAFEFDEPGVPGGRAVCAGGRYTGVAGDVSGVGFALGLERMEAAILRASQLSPRSFGTDLDASIFSIAVVALVDDDYDGAVRRTARRITFALRAFDLPATVAVERCARVRKMVGRAVRDGHSVVVVVGSKDVHNNQAQVKLIAQDHRVNITPPIPINLNAVADYIRQQASKSLNIKS